MGVEVDGLEITLASDYGLHELSSRGHTTSVRVASPLAVSVRHDMILFFNSL